jgi:hypothetical protein
VPPDEGVRVGENGWVLALLEIPKTERLSQLLIGRQVKHVERGHPDKQRGPAPKEGTRPTLPPETDGAIENAAVRCPEQFRALISRHDDVGRDRKR